jgi:hypothetical protein
LLISLLPESVHDLARVGKGLKDTMLRESKTDSGVTEYGVLP